MLLSTGIIKLSGLMFPRRVKTVEESISLGVSSLMSWEGISDSAIEFLCFSGRNFGILRARSDCSSQSLLQATLNTGYNNFLTDNITSRLEAREFDLS